MGTLEDKSSAGKKKAYMKTPELEGGKLIKCTRTGNGVLNTLGQGLSASGREVCAAVLVGKLWGLAVQA
jgi:hypothetical protein